MAVEELRPPNRIALFGMAYAMIGGLVVIVISALTGRDASQFLGTASIGLLVAGASAMAGGLLGFLFGIPRALQASDMSATQAVRRAETAGATNDQGITYGANTNLEQISDWLTKILVGVGLTQLTVLPEKFQGLALFLSPGFNAVSRPEVMAATVVLYFTISGFLFGYLWTRLFLGEALREADVAALGQKVSELERQMSEDARALSLVQQQLNPRTDAPAIPQDTLRKAILEASPSAKTTIFYQAWDMRSKNWRNDKPRMQRTIPIFRALAESDTRDEYHANHGQLGFALKDKEDPNWEEAERELTKAIEIRGDWRTHGWLYYEFNRAICLIQLEGKMQEARPGVSPNRERILADLRAVASNDELLKMISEEHKDTKVVRDWMTRNQIKTESLWRSDTQA